MQTSRPLVASFPPLLLLLLITIYFASLLLLMFDRVVASNSVGCLSVHAILLVPSQNQTLGDFLAKYTAISLYSPCTNVRMYVDVRTSTAGCHCRPASIPSSLSS